MKSAAIRTVRAAAGWRVAAMMACAIACCLAGARIGRGAEAQPGSDPQAVPQALCDLLVRVMKQGPALGFAGRVKALAPELSRQFDLPLTTRLVVGPPWRSMTAEQQQQLVAAFSDYSTAVYASRFKDYSGERFIVDPNTAKLASGDVIVHTRLLPHEGEPVQLDYVMRAGADGWRIIDVLLNGTISEMAERRSEFSAALRDGGAAGLISLLRQKTAQLAG